MLKIEIGKDINKIACNPNFDDKITTEERIVPSINVNDNERFKLIMVTIKKMLTITSENKRGVKQLIRGPIESLENHIGVKIYNAEINNASSVVNWILKHVIKINTVKNESITGFIHLLNFTIISIGKSPISQ